jgi:twinkle protein
MLTERHQALLEARGLDVELCARHGWGSSARLGPDTIEIPYYMAGERVNTKYRTISGEKRFAQDEGGKCVFWNCDVIADQSLAHLPLVITEGEFDAMAALQAGFDRTVSVPNGAPSNPLGETTTGKYVYLDAAPQTIRDVREIVLATDGDTPGIALRDDLALRLGRARCKFLHYPKHTKDLADVLGRYAERGIVETLARAQWLAVSGIYKLSELPPLNPPEALVSGFPGLSEHYRMRVGDFCVVTGAPGKGKTTFTRELACHMASRYQWKVALASFEAIPQIDHKRAIRSWHSGELVRDMQQDGLDAADAWTDEYFRFLVPDEDEEVTLDWVVERISTAAIRDHIKLAIVDPWNEMDHIRPPDLSLTEYVGAALRRLKRMARTLGIHLIVAAHPTKLYRNRDGKYPTPTLYDISDSAMWYNRADVGLIVDRPDRGTDMSLIQIAKVRFQDQIGTPGDVSVRFNGVRYELG